MRERTNRTFPIQEDMRFQIRSWIVERAGWIVLAVMIALALTGALGLGPLADARSESVDRSLSVQYERFQRITRLTKFTFTLPGAGTNLALLRLSPLFQDVYEIMSVAPAPERSSAGPEGFELRFAPPRTGDLTVVIWASPRRSGAQALTAQTEAGGPAGFSIFVYP